MARENKTEYMILGMLNHKPMSGYDIKQAIEYSIRYFWNAGFGQIYPSLKSLLERKLIKEASTGESQHPRTIRYTITGSGKRALKEWLKVPVEEEHIRYEILLKLYFGSVISPDYFIKTIEEFKEKSNGHLETMKLYEHNLKEELEGNIDHHYYLLTVLFGKKIYEAYNQWADEAMDYLIHLKESGGA